MIIPALKRGGYTVSNQGILIGLRLGGKKHLVDRIAENSLGEKFLISLKWQQVSGTAEQKIPFEVICLCNAVKTGEYKLAYLVLGGPGWSLREFYVNRGLDEYLHHEEFVRIVTLEDFVALANKGQL